MSELDWIAAAELALPVGSRASHQTRFRRLGLDIGPLRPFHFTIEGDLHIDLRDIFLHRTCVMPRCDERNVSAVAAFIGYAASARAIDLIKAGDWLLYNQHMTVAALLEAVCAEPWRPGAKAALWITEFLCAKARSVKESETRAILQFAGLPVPEVNKDVVENGVFLGCVDLLYEAWRVVVEYEGRQHAETIDQWNIDIDRYAGFHDHAYAIVQVTQEKLRRPRSVVMRVHRKIVEGGYHGPVPVFGARWRSLFEPAVTADRVGLDVRASDPAARWR